MAVNRYQIQKIVKKNSAGKPIGPSFVGDEMRHSGPVLYPTFDFNISSETPRPSDVVIPQYFLQRHLVWPQYPSDVQEGSSGVVPHSYENSVGVPTKIPRDHQTHSNEAAPNRGQSIEGLDASGMFWSVGQFLGSMVGEIKTVLTPLLPPPRNSVQSQIIRDDRSRYGGGRATRHHSQMSPGSKNLPKAPKNDQVSGSVAHVEIKNSTQRICQSDLSHLRTFQYMPLIDWGRWIRQEYRNLVPNSLNVWIRFLVGTWHPQADLTAVALEKFGPGAFKVPAMSPKKVAFALKHRGNNSFSWQYKTVEVYRANPSSHRVSSTQLIFTKMRARVTRFTNELMQGYLLSPKDRRKVRDKPRMIRWNAVNLREWQQLGFLRLIDWGYWLKVEYRTVAPRSLVTWIKSLTGYWYPQVDGTANAIDQYGAGAFQVLGVSQNDRILILGATNSRRRGWRWIPIEVAPKMKSVQTVHAGPMKRVDIGEKVVEVLPTKKPMGLATIKQDRIVQDIDYFAASLHKENMPMEVIDKTAGVIDQFSEKLGGKEQNGRKAISVNRYLSIIVNEESPLEPSPRISSAQEFQNRSQHFLHHDWMTSSRKMAPSTPPAKEYSRVTPELDRALCPPSSLTSTMLKVMIPFYSGWQKWVQEMVFNLYYLAQIPLDAAVFQGVRPFWYFKSYLSYAKGLAALIELVEQQHKMKSSKIPSISLWFFPMSILTLQNRFNRIAKHLVESK